MTYFIFLILLTIGCFAGSIFYLIWGTNYSIRHNWVFTIKDFGLCSIWIIFFSVSIFSLIFTIFYGLQLFK
jgi:hypothetical protein